MDILAVSELSYNVTKPSETENKIEQAIPKNCIYSAGFMIKFNINDTELSASFEVVFNVRNLNVFPLIIRATYLKYKVTNMRGYPFLTGGFSHFSQTGEREERDVL